MVDSNFVNRLNCRWIELRQGILEINNLHNYIDGIASTLNESQQRNFTQWPILGAYIFPNPQNQVSANYQTEVADLKTWIDNRINWLDTNMPGICTGIGIGIPKRSVNDNSISVYPNPFTSTTTFELNLTEEADVSLKIIDIMGKEVSTLINEHKPAGEFKIIFDKMKISAGIYFYQLKIKNVIKTGKIIIQ